MEDLLINKPDSIELSKQHQIFGAINEIDVFLQTLKEYHEKTSCELKSKPLDFYSKKKDESNT